MVSAAIAALTTLAVIGIAPVGAATAPIPADVAAITAVAVPPPVQVAGTIDTVLGGLGRGPATGISQEPTELAFGGGKLFVADDETAVLRRVDLTSGVENVYAGTGGPWVSGTPIEGVPATQAPFATRGMLADSAGNLYFTHDARVLKITTDGNLHVIAGSEQSGYSGDGGPAAAARFISPGALTFGLDGSLYVVDYPRVRKIAPNGTITTVAGNGYAYPPGAGDGGPAVDATMGPRNIAVDSLGRLLISDQISHTVHRVGTDGVVHIIAGNGETDGGGDGLPALQASLGYIASMAVGAGDRLFVGDIEGKVRTIGPDGIVHVYAGTGPKGQTGDGGPALNATTWGADALVQGSGGELYLADHYDSRVRRIGASGQHIISTIAGNGRRNTGGDGGPATDAQVSPAGLTSDRHGGFYVVDNGAAALRHVNASGTVSLVAGGDAWWYDDADGDGGPAVDAHLSSIGGITTDEAGNLFLSQPMIHRVRRIDTSGTITTVAGTGTSGWSGDGGPATAARIAGPASLVVDRHGNLVIADAGGYVVRSITPDGTISTIAGVGQANEWGDGGPATSAALFAGRLVARPSGGLLVVGRDRIREISEAGTIDTIAGGTGDEVLDGQLATAGSLGFINDIALAPQGDLYFTGTHDRLRVISPSGRVDTVAGEEQPGFGGDGGPAAAAKLFSPGNLTLDERGDLLFIDNLTRVRRIAIGPPLTPRDLRAERGHGLVRLTWVRPTFDGGAAITSYVVKAMPGNHSCTPVALADERFTCRVSGLTPGAAYTFSVVATNSIGTTADPATAAATPAVGDGYHPVTPFRLLDSRTGNGGYTMPWTAGTTRSVKVTGVGDPAPAPSVPSSGVSAVVLNVTVTDTTTPGFLTVFPAGVDIPVASNLNWNAGQTIPNLVTVQVGTGGKVDVYNAVGWANVIADVVGYYDDGTPAADFFTPLDPSRLLDSRTGTGGFSTPWSPNQVRSLTVLGAGGVPTTDVTSVVLNVTVTDTTTPGFLTAYPTGAPGVPNASNLNWNRGDTVANLVTVAVGPGGKVDLFNQAGSVNVIADVVGYYGAFGSAFHPLAPKRVLDSRDGTGLFGSWQRQEIRDLDVTDTYQSGVPDSGAEAIVMNVTVTDTQLPGFLTIYPTVAHTPPNASNLNWGRGATIPNLTITRLPSSGFLSVYNASEGRTQVIADVVGWFG